MERLFRELVVKVADGQRLPLDPMGLSSKARRWAEGLGQVVRRDSSAKISNRAITVARPLVEIQLSTDVRNPNAPTGSLFERILGACLDIEMPNQFAAEAAPLIASTGRFHFGEQYDDTGTWRRKIYLQRPSDSDIKWLMESWPSYLMNGSGPVEWVAWKWSNSPQSVAERSIEWGYLGGAETVGEVVNPLLEAMGSDWVKVINHFVSMVYPTGGARPHQSDVLTFDEGGRRTADLGMRGAIRERSLAELESELRWMAAVAGHDRTVTETLISWAPSSRPSVLIFGVDGDSQPFVNLYVSDS